MSPAIHTLIPILAFCALANLAGCGGGGGGSDDAPPAVTPDPIPEPPTPDPYSIDSYTEYSEGTDLSGIWMMVINTEYDVETSQGTQHASEVVRSTVFIKEFNDGSSSSIEVSSPTCVPQPIHADYSGSNVEISGPTLDYHLTVSTNSRMSGTLESYYPDYCGSLGDICLGAPNSTNATVEMVKVAALPFGNWGDFENVTPPIGSIMGVVQTDATTDAFEFDNEVDCFMQSRGNNSNSFSASIYGASSGPDYESIIVSTEEGDNLMLTQSGGILEYANVRSSYYPYYGLNLQFIQRTRNFDMNVDGANPITIGISADASNDASSDGAELDIQIDL